MITETSSLYKTALVNYWSSKQPCHVFPFCIEPVPLWDRDILFEKPSIVFSLYCEDHQHLWTYEHARAFVTDAFIVYTNELFCQMKDLDQVVYYIESMFPGNIMDKASMEHYIWLHMIKTCGLFISKHIFYFKIMKWFSEMFPLNHHTDSETNPNHTVSETNRSLFMKRMKELNHPHRLLEYTMYKNGNRKEEKTT